MTSPHPHASFVSKWKFLIGFGILAIVLMQSFVWVSDAESVTLYRLGKPLRSLASGFHWQYPYPIDRVERIPLFRSVLLTHSDFKTALPQALLAKPPDTLNPAEDAFLLTADGTIITVPTCALIWSVDPEQLHVFNAFYRTCPAFEQGLIRDDTPRCHPFFYAQLTRSLVTVSAGMSAAEILAQPARFNDAVLSDFQTHISPKTHGVIVERVQATVVLPLQLGFSYENATAAATQGEHRILTAQTAATQTLSMARQEAEQKILTAQIEAGKNVAEAQRQTQQFTQILERYEANPNALLHYLRSQAVYDILQNANERFLLDANTLQQLRVTLSRSPRDVAKSKGANP